jgi:hypothetical protein
MAILFIGKPIKQGVSDMSKYPFQILLEDAPCSEELDYQISNDFNFWSKASDSEIVEEIEYVISTYYESGHDNYETLHPIGVAPLKYRKEAKEAQAERRKELKELKAVLIYVEKQSKAGGE